MTKTFIEKLVEVQQLLKAPKSQFNAFAKYHYRSAEDIASSPRRSYRYWLNEIKSSLLTMIWMGGVGNARLLLLSSVMVLIALGWLRYLLESKCVDASSVARCTYSLLVVPTFRSER